ncbi:hypothetical protein P5V15_002738 [Pogonomyrmex californicus]
MFGPRMEKNLFRSINVIVKASKSGKMIAGIHKFQLSFCPNVGTDSVLLIDSWSGHCPDIVSDLTPCYRENTIIRCYGFRLWENFVKNFSDTVLLLESDMNLYQRNNIIKLQSLIHYQLSSPRYQLSSPYNLFKYSCFKSGYTNKSTEDDIENCNNIAVIRCSWCKGLLFLKHFFVKYHYYNICDE